MLLYVIFGFLAAFGLLCAALVLRGLCFQVRSKCTVAVICPKGREIAVIRRFCCLRQFGLTSASLTVLDASLTRRQQRQIQSRYPYIYFSTRQAWRTGQGRACIDHANRNGDSAGHHRCGGLPEL